jgi:hypothetical protein
LSARAGPPTGQGEHWETEDEEEIEQALEEVITPALEHQNADAGQDVKRLEESRDRELMFNRVLLTGLLYILFWESLLARFIPGIRMLSIRHYVQSVYASILDDGRVSVAQQTATSTSLVVLLGLVLVCVALSHLRLSRMDLD